MGGSGSFGIFGATFALDYFLGKYCFSVGGELGYIGGNSYTWGFGAVPVLGRLGYHPDLGVNNLDIYGLLKLGFAMGIGEDEKAFGFGIGFGLGGRYFFTNKFGVFTELGFERYSFAIEGGDIKFTKIFTIGATYKM